MSDRDPRRLLDPSSELDPRLRALLQSGRDELPSSARLGQMAVRLGPDFAGAQPGGVARVLASRAVLPRLILGLVLAGAGSGVYLATRDAERAPLPALGESGSRVVAGAPAVSPAREEAVIASPGRVQQLDPGPSEAAPHARRLQPARVKSHATDPLAELALLDAAQSALGHEPALALARTEMHARRYVHGQYEQEREILAIEALLRLGRGELAQVRAERFLERFAGSSYATRARQQLARARD